MDREYRRLTGTTALFAGANIVCKLLRILIVPLYTYCLTTSEFGTAEAVIMTVNLLYPVLLLGIGEAAVRFSLREKWSRESVVSNSFAVVSVTAAAGLVLLLPLSFIPMLRERLAVLYVMAAAAAVESLMMSLAKGFGRNTVYAASEIVSTAVLLGSELILLLLLGKGMEGYLWSFAAASAARIVFISCFLRPFGSLKLRAVDRRMIISMLRFSVPFMPAALLWWVMDSSGRYMVIRFNGTSDAGIYAAAFRMAALVNGLAVVFHQAWQLSAIRRYGKEGCESFFRTAMKGYSTLFFTGASVLIAVAKPAVQLLDDAYSDAWRYAPMLLTAAVFFALSGFACANYFVCDKTGGVFWTSLAGAAVSVVSGALLTPKFGMNGTAAAALISYYVLWLMMSAHTGKLLGFRQGYLMIHIGLLILLAETVTVVRQWSPLLTVSCILLLLLLNGNELAGMIRGLSQLVKERNDILH